MSSQYHQSQYILNQCFNNKQNTIRVNLNTVQDYLNAVFDNSKNALRVSIDGGVLPTVAGISVLPSSATNGQIAPVYDATTDSVELYVWLDSEGAWTQNKVVGADDAPTATLTPLTGADVSVAPWQRYEWTMSGNCSIEAPTGWSVTGAENCEIYITVAPNATLSSTTIIIGENDVIEAAGLYVCTVESYNGMLYFRVGPFIEAAS